ncbi:hypothetical protein [Neobacillus sp. Marseille-QA0830]
MGKSKSAKSKWLIGVTGTALSAFVIGQVGGGQPNDAKTNLSEAPVTKSMSKQEQEYVKLDWSNYNINGSAVSDTVSGGVRASDRQTRRS